MAMNREKIKLLMSIADTKLTGTYHQIYMRFGAEKSKGENFHCFNKSFHDNGKDSNPSMGINNNTGQYHCFACGEKGNLYTYWKNYISNGSDKYHDFLDSEFGIHINSEDVESKDIIGMKEIYKEFASEYQDKSGEEYILPDSVSDEIDEESCIDMGELDKYVNNLLDNEKAMNYLFKTRNITEEVVKSYKIGIIDAHSKNKMGFVFPIMSPDGKISTMKKYNPFVDKKYKWRYIYRDRVSYPSPIQNFANDRLYFFEGEPDTYCAISFGIKGAITLGSAGNTDPSKTLGNELTKQYLENKEVVICFDADKAGVHNATKLAANIYKYVRQIKIIDFNMSDLNPLGLDETAMRDVLKNGKVEKERSEKDFTEFMKKNGFGNSAREVFYKLIDDTNAYTDDTDRSNVETYKVTVQESRLPKYHSLYGGTKKVIQTTATVSDMDNNAYMYYKELPVECVMMGGGDLQKMCSYCSLPLIDGFNDGLVNFKFKRNLDKGDKDDSTVISVTEKDVLEMIEVTERQRQYKLKQICGINGKCQRVRLREGIPVKVSHVVLKNDISFYRDLSEKDGGSANDVDVDAYIENYDLDVGKTYRFEGVQTTSPVGQYAAIYSDKIEPVVSTIDSFTMNQDIHSELKVFRVSEGESISSALERRYKSFSVKSGITGRAELYFMYDLSFFSLIEYESKIIPNSVRKWVEVGVVGESRVGKTAIAKFLLDKYRFGEFIGGSSSVSRAGILGGIVKQLGGKSKISWGIIPRNDKGLVVIDETEKMSPNILIDMTSSRSSGVVDIEMTVSGNALARTRKIFIANPRDKDAIQSDPFMGISAINQVYLRDEIIQRFDIMHFAMSDDVDISTFDYKHESNEIDDFTDLQTRHLLMWAHSRTKDDFVWEDGQDSFNEYVASKSEELRKIFHERILLVGQETSVRLVRMSVALAGIMYSTFDGNYNKLYIKKEHVDHVVKFTMDIYTSRNLRFDEYSKQIRSQEELGDMNFMENIIKYVNIESIIREHSFDEKAIQQVFFDYLYRVNEKRLFMVDASSDKRKTTGIPVHISSNKLVQTLVSRNCLVRRKRKLEKTPMFTEWLESMKGVDENELSNILEYDEDTREADKSQRLFSLAERFEKDKRTGTNDS